MKKSKNIPKGWKWVIQGLPLAAAGVASLLPLQRLGQQFLVLIVLIWLQVFIVVECFLFK
jgi:hypothetical protein